MNDDKIFYDNILEYAKNNKQGLTYKDENRLVEIIKNKKVIPTFEEFNFLINKENKTLTKTSKINVKDVYNEYLNNNNNYFFKNIINHIRKKERIYSSEQDKLFNIIKNKSVIPTDEQFIELINNNILSKAIKEQLKILYNSNLTSILEEEEKINQFFLFFL
jgi:hypothetical protein